MAPQGGAAGAVWEQGERGRRVTRHSDWSIGDGGAPSHCANPGAEQAPGTQKRARQRVDCSAGTRAGVEEARQEEGAAKRH